MSADVFVDSNIFLYAAAPDDSKMHRAEALLASLHASHTLAVSPQVIAEVFVNVERVYGTPAAFERITALRNSAELQPLDSVTTDATLRIKNRYGFSYWDAQVLAAAHAAGATLLLTEDLQDGQVIEGVTVVDPFREGFDLSSLKR